MISFFSYELIPSQSQEYNLAVQEHEKLVAQRQDVLNEIKTLSKGSTEYNKYLILKEKTDSSWKNITEIKQNQKFINFKNLQHFLGEFGWAMGLLLYSIFNLSLAIVKKDNSLIGQLALHTTLIFISLYFINWCLMPSDYSKTMYFVYASIMTVSVCLSTNILLKSKLKYLIHLQDSIRLIFHFLYKEAEEKELINPEKNKDFRKIRMKLTDKIVGNE